jgi:hypothetical protein
MNQVSARDDRESEPFAWRCIPRYQVSEWNRLLLKTDASYHQYPFWNEPQRLIHFSPVYLTCDQDGDAYAYVCILSVGLPGVRFGLIHRGPVMLAGAPLDKGVLESLRVWGRQNGFICLRFVSFNPMVSEAILSLPHSQAVDGFPLYSGLSRQELRVNLDTAQDEVMKGFSSTARNEIRAAARSGYEVSVSRDPQDVLDLWRMFTAMAQRKGISFPRPARVWAKIIEEGGPQKCATIYTANLAGKSVQVILVVRDARVAEYVLGALDTENLSTKVSPSCLLHWRAMCDSQQLGCKWYDLGSPSGPVLQFKLKFRPERPPKAATLTLVTKPLLYNLWSVVVLKTLLPLWPSIRGGLSKLLAASARKRR